MESSSNFIPARTSRSAIHTPPYPQHRTHSWYRNEATTAYCTFCHTAAACVSRGMRYSTRSSASACVHTRSVRSLRRSASSNSHSGMTRFTRLGLAAAAPPSPSAGTSSTATAAAAPAAAAAPSSSSSESSPSRIITSFTNRRRHPSLYACHAVGRPVFSTTVYVAVPCAPPPTLKRVPSLRVFLEMDAVSKMDGSTKRVPRRTETVNDMGTPFRRARSMRFGSPRGPSRFSRRRSSWSALACQSVRCFCTTASSEFALRMACRSELSSSGGNPSAERALRYASCAAENFFCSFASVDAARFARSSATVLCAYSATTTMNGVLPAASTNASCCSMRR